MKNIKIFWLPIILLWRDRTIKTGGRDHIIAPMIYIRKGRTLTVEEFDNTQSKPLMIATLLPVLFKVYGNIRIVRKAVPMERNLITDLFKSDGK